MRPEARFASAQEFAAALAPWATLEEAEPLSAWVSRLQQVALAPLPPRASGPSRPVAPAAKPIALPESAVAPIQLRPPPSKSKRRRWLGAAALGALVVVVGSWSTLTASDGPAVPTRPLELTSIPSGATIFVDAVVVGRTPLTLQFAKNEMRRLTLRKAGFNNWEGVARNTGRLQIDLATGQQDTTLYDGDNPLPARPREPPPPPEPVHTGPSGTIRPAPPPTDGPPTAELVYDVEMPPVKAVLSHHTSVIVDDTPLIEIPDGAEVEVANKGAFYRMPDLDPSNRGRGPANLGLMERRAMAVAMTPWRTVGVFALRRTQTGVEAFDVNKPRQFPHGGALHFFMPTEGANDQLRGDITLTVDGSAVALKTSAVLPLRRDDSFLVRVLNPALSYRLTLAREDGSKDPIPPVLISLRPTPPTTHRYNDRYPSGDSAASLRVDGEPIESQQALLGAGAHTLSGATSILFTLPTLEGVVPPEVSLSLTVQQKPSRDLEAEQAKLKLKVHHGGEKPAVNPHR